MVRLGVNDLGRCFPELLDGFVGRFEPECLELLGEVLGGQPVAGHPAFRKSQGQFSLDAPLRLDSGVLLLPDWLND